jgi:hypothetical protein
MRRAVFLSVLTPTVVASAIACGGIVAPDLSLDLDPAAGDSGLDARADAGRDVGRDAADARRDTGRDALVTEPDAWIDPGCPDLPPPPKDFACDPLKPAPGDCPRGQACYPFVEYPEEPCEPERYFARCAPAGSGTQGDPCSGQRCSAGFACVASGAGNQCVALCDPKRTGGCPAGLVCSPTDVIGVGACL